MMLARATKARGEGRETNAGRSFSTTRQSSPWEHEREADRTAARVVAGLPAPPAAPVAATPPSIQRKCSGCAASAPCSTCAEPARQPDEDEDQAPGLRLQRKAVAGARATGAPSRSSEGRLGAVAVALVDEGLPIGPGQMERAAFMAAVRERVYATCEAELARVQRSAADCPYIRQWLAYYDRRSARDIERAFVSYSGEEVRDPTAMVAAIERRVRAAVRIWTTTGAVTGIPPQLPGKDPPSEPGTKAPAEGHDNPPRGVQMKPKGNAGAVRTDPAAVRAQLRGGGRALDGGLRARMEHGFGHSFASVRIHTGSQATGLANSLDARAFTVGSDIAFAPGQFRPGTMEGDLLIAHELAHTIQQGAAGQGPEGKAGMGETTALEHEADQAAVGAVGFGLGLTDRQRPAAQGGLRLQRCSNEVKRCKKGYGWRVVNAVGAGPTCVCTWKCTPGENPLQPHDPPPNYGPTVDCPAGGCSKTYFKDVDDDYSQTHTYVGAHMTPLGDTAACGCLPLDMDGDPVSDVPLRPSDFEMTDVVGPLVDVAAARQATNSRTGVRQPSNASDEVTANKDPISPPPSHVGAPPELPELAGGAKKPGDNKAGGTRKGGADKTIIDPRPHVTQEDPFGCGGACGEMAAGVHGTTVSQGKLVASPHFDQGIAIAGEILNGTRGFKTVELSKALEENAPIAGRRWTARDIFPDSWKNPVKQPLAEYQKLLKDTLDRGGGVFIARWGMSRDHWVVVDAVSATQVQLRDPAKKQTTVIPISEFQQKFPGDAVYSESAP